MEKPVTVEPGFNEPLYKEDLGITNDTLQPGQNTVKCMEQNLDITNLVIANKIEKPKRKISPDITNKCHHATKKMNAKQTNSDENPLTLSQESNFSVNGSRGCTA